MILKGKNQKSILVSSIASQFRTLIVDAAGYSTFVVSADPASAEYVFRIRSIEDLARGTAIEAISKFIVERNIQLLVFYANCPEDAIKIWEELGERIFQRIQGYTGMSIKECLITVQEEA